jgi:hypothetical protein
MPWKSKTERAHIFRFSPATTRPPTLLAWWELPVLILITIPALPGYLGLLLWGISALLVAAGGPSSPSAHSVEAWFFGQLLLGIISYPVALVFIIILSIAKFRCRATKLGWLIVVGGAVIWLTMFKIVLGGPW